MTDARTTQVAVEQWAGGGAAARASQVIVEQWASLSVGSGQALVSQVVVEHWAIVAAAQTTIPSVSVVT